MPQKESTPKGRQPSESPEGAAGGESRVSVRDRRKLRDEGQAGVSGEARAAGTSAVETPGEATTPTAGGNGGATVGDVPSVAEELAAAREQAATYLDDLQRMKAEFDNYRKRTLKEQSRLVDNAAVGLIAQLLGVLDDFELAVAAAEETRDFDRMLKGVEMVFGELKEVLGSAGLEKIEAKGKPFDPRLHEAALEAPGDGSGVVVVSDVLRNGYQFKGMVLRPAMVKVTQDASGGKATQETEPAGNE